MLTIFFSTNKNVATFSQGEAKEGVVFSQAPCISQAPFNVPIRGGYQGGARLSKMDCSDTTQSLQVSLEGQFKKSFFGPKFLDSRGRKTLSCVSTKHEQLEPLHFCLCRKRPRKKKKQFGCGIHFCWFALQNFFTRGGLAAVPPAHPKSNLAVAKERSAKVGLCKTAPAKHTSIFLWLLLRQQQQQAKYGPYILKSGVVK